MTTSPTASQFQVSTSSATHFIPNMNVRHMFAATSLMLRVCRRLSAAMSFMWADITLNIFYSPRMVEEIKEEKNWNIKQQTVIWPNYLNYLNYSV